jgi:hypothetical protein
MKEIEIIEVPMSKDQKLVDDLNKEYYGGSKPYYIGYQKDPAKQASVLFADLKWIRKVFGVDKNEASPITFESLNAARRNEIARYERALKLNVPMYELSYFNQDDTVKQYENKMGEMVDYRPMKLSEQGKKQFQANIDKGLYVLCKLV